MTQITLDPYPIPPYPTPMAILKTEPQPETATQCEVCDAPLAVGEVTQTCPDCGRVTGLECCAVVDADDDTFICCTECDEDDEDNDLDSDDDDEDLDDDLEDDDDLEEGEDDDDDAKI